MPRYITDRRKKITLDENTEERRNKRFKAKPQGYEGTILQMQKSNHINAINLIKRVRKGVLRIESAFSKKGLTKSEIAFRQGLFVNRQAAHLTDAIIDATMGIRQFEALPIAKRNEIWEREFENAVKGLSAVGEIKNRPLIFKQMENIERYLSLPDALFSSRKRHWKLIEKVEQKLQTKADAIEQNLHLEIEKILSKKRSGENNRVKAVDICVAASIYADVMEKRGGSWVHHYREAMQLIYPTLAKNQEILEAVIELK